MAHTVVFDPPLIRVMIDDLITIEGTSAILGELEALERRLPKTPDRVFDLTGVTGGSLHFADVLRITDHRKKVEFPNLFRTAIVAPTPVGLGYARMFQTLNDHPQITIKTFATIDAAETWLGVRP